MSPRVLPLPEPLMQKPKQPAKPALSHKHVKLDFEHLRENRLFVRSTDEESKIAISAFKSLRTHMLREMRERSVRTLVVTGPAKGVGKSMVAANLALNIARHKAMNVTLVDLDLRSPSIAKLFGLEPDIGIDHAQHEGFDLERAMIYPDIERFRILPAVQSHEDSAEILLSQPFIDTLTKLQSGNENQVVIFDAPPLLGCDDIPALASLIELSLVVIGEGETSRRELRQAMSMMTNIPIAAILMNKSSQDFFKTYYY